jgi:hypothetical protein
MAVPCPLRFFFALALLIGAEGRSQTTVVFQNGVSPSPAYAGTKDVTITNSVDTEAVWDPSAVYDGIGLQLDGVPSQKHFLIRFNISSLGAVTVQSASLQLSIH